MKTPCPSLVKALQAADWERLLPQLAGYAKWRLRCVGWAHGRDHEPNRMSAMDAVNLTVDRCLHGKRHWDEKNPPELFPFLCGVIKSLISDERKAFRRDKADLVGEAIDGEVDSASVERLEATPEEEEGRSAICAAVEACVQGDEDLEMFRLAVLDGHTKRDDIATALGWTSERVSAVRIKLQRRLNSRFSKEFSAITKRRGAS